MSHPDPHASKDEAPSPNAPEGELPGADVVSPAPPSSAAKSDRPTAEEEATIAPVSTREDRRGAEGPDAVFSKGNPLNKRAIGSIVLGILGLFFLMAKNAQWRVGVPLGLLFALIATFGVMDLLGTFDDREEHVATRTTLSRIALPLVATLGGFSVFAGALAAAQAAVFHLAWGWGVIVTAAFIAFIAALFRLGVAVGPFAKDELGEDRPLHRRHGFWLIAFAGLLYFPALGVFSLWDPWETHYGEVAREVLARDDWISLWWAQDGWFWSKPILNFWIQALAMASLGTQFQPDQMLIGTTASNAHPEWVVRTPNVLMTILALYVVYKGVAKVFGRRAGLLGGLVLATMSDWFFLAHQTMTDMPCISAMTAAMGMLLLGLHTHEDARVQLYELEIFGRRLRLSGWHLAFGAILLCALPQILYLFTRNLELVLYGSGAKGFRFHLDEFRSGSAGNCTLPGNEACRMNAPASIPKGLATNPVGFGPTFLRVFGSVEPGVQAFFWIAVLSGLLYLNWGERRARRLFYIGAWFFAAIATMGKGPLGFVLPGVCAFAYIATKKRWSELTKLEAWSGFLIIGVVALPWFVAMYVRHGSPFTDRLIFHDMFNRAFSHVHDTNEGDDTSIRFYMWQLGYALFPWTGLVPLGLTYWLRRSDSADRGKGDVSVFLAMWFVFAFGLFTFMGTKFHHYIFPAVPPAALLVGIVLDEALGRGSLVARGRLPLYAGGLLAGMLSLAYGLSRFFPGSFLGTKLGDKPTDLAEPSTLAGALGILVGLGLMVAAVLLNRAGGNASEGSSEDAAIAQANEKSPYRGGLAILPANNDRRTPHEELMMGAAGFSGAMLLVLVGRDLATKPFGTDQPGAIRLLQLFTYNYRRAWPDTLDFGAILKAFVLLTVVLSILFAARRLRAHVVSLHVALGFVFALWGLDVYMVKTAPHWGQHELMEAYYRTRAGAAEPLVAYQMNWKGENFYTGNHVPAFVSSGAPFTKWVKEQRDKGVKVMFFVTEPGRLGGLRSEAGARTYTEITDKALNNKFVVVRAEF